mgnify:CR=1 FL=1
MMMMMMIDNAIGQSVNGFYDTICVFYGSKNGVFFRFVFCFLFSSMMMLSSNDKLKIKWKIFFQCLKAKIVRNETQQQPKRMDGYNV